MSRIASKFEALRQDGRRALIPYIMAGDPEPWLTVSLMHALVNSGADILELGVPFSDPMADGPVIQRASERALRHKISLTRVLEIVHEFREKDKTTPIVLMGYLNPIEVMGYVRFATSASDAGVDGVLTVDMPPEEAQGLQAALKPRGLDTIFLLAPTSSTARIKRIARAAHGFIYYVSLRGVTGAANLNVAEVAGKLKEIRQHTKLPLGVGFGISGPEVAAQVAESADAVIVGSAVVRRMEEMAGNPDKILKEVPAFIARLRAAMDRVTLVPISATGANR
ncbi:MAG: tryptophan synthase subunit alpha [Gammaproteobacteria bacterium]|nr:tryptophan synthase subunit alpha [Gammaproteobacteria bacterium]MDH3369893.1 tryptophan synthase subunit alpha [Gammaproteobacteria bacterium]MDH3407154.1 tryptophan synthase subunit alpha [Gammaproteobacteria bacterium]MDH3561940.1 tryptophan synthase subunit alpha [Gammaproteobacteria bacterium]